MLRSGIEFARPNAVRSYWTLLFLWSLTVGAAEPASAPAEIPCHFRDGLIWIEARVSGSSGPLHFLLDSGAQVSVIDARTAQALGLKRGRPTRVDGVGSTTIGYWPQCLEAYAGPVQLPCHYLLLDLGKLSAACTNSTVDGIIGADFFRDRIVQISFQWQAVRLLREPPAEVGMQVLPLKIRPGGMLVPVGINGVPGQWLRLDTGCASALHWVTRSIRPQDCTKRVAVALTSFSVPMTRTSLTLGAVRLEGVPTDLRETPIFPGEKGLLGNGVLSRFQTVTIDSKGKKLMLGPGD